MIMSCGTILDQNFGNTAPNAKPGKCYEKCLYPNVMGTDTHRFFRYTGTAPPNDSTIKVSEFMTKEATTKWTRKVSDDIQPVDGKDSVWCLIEVPPVIETYVEVTDTSKVKEFVSDSLIYDVVVKKRGYTMWKEIVCEKDQDEHLIADIQKHLLDAGYDTSADESGVLGEVTKKALIKYQKEKDLPVGSLNIETMIHLGVY